jgi:hypothetical protein
MSAENYRSGITVIATGLLVSWSERGATLTVSTSGQQVHVEMTAEMFKQLASTIKFAKREREAAVLRETEQAQSTANGKASR